MTFLPQQKEIKPRGMLPRQGSKLRSLLNTNTLGWIFIHMVTLSHILKGKNLHVWAL